MDSLNLNKASKVKFFNNDGNENEKFVQIGCSNFIISDGGFLMQKSSENDFKNIPVTNKPPPDYKKLSCIECQKMFCNSFLLNNFDEKVCEECRESNENYKLIARTQVLNTFPLKPYDLDIREPILKFITRRNPHSSKTQMKLYLTMQIQKRAIEIWGSDEEVQNQMDLRAERSRKIVHKRLQKKTELLQKRLCRQVNIEERYKVHEHSFGEEEVVDVENDVYRRKCLLCTYVEEFEKL